MFIKLDCPTSIYNSSYYKSDIESNEGSTNSSNLLNIYNIVIGDSGSVAHPTDVLQVYGLKDKAELHKT
jgi:hypothetical protein